MDEGKYKQDGSDITKWKETATAVPWRGNLMQMLYKDVILCNRLM